MIGGRRVGLWTMALDRQHPVVAERAVQQLEDLGYGVLWIPEALTREVISHATLLLAASRSIVVATGIARIHARTPQATALAQQLLVERFPGRFVLGLGVSHPPVIERMLGLEYGQPLTSMREYLDAMDRLHPAPGPRVLAALGPKMLELSVERTDGAHTYLTPVPHTAWAREHVGPTAEIAVAIKVVLTEDAEQGFEIARRSLRGPTRLPAYRANIARFDFDDSDLAGDLSNRLVQALVAVGDEAAIVSRVQEHLDAGASQVCVEVLTGDDTTLPMAQWTRLAPALAALG